MTESRDKVAMAGLVLARVVDPVTAQQVGGMITGWGEDTNHPILVGDLIRG